MQAIPLVRTTTIRPVLDHLERIGVRPAPALERARELLHDSGALIPVSSAGELFEDAARAAGDAAFGLRVGEATRAVDLGEWGSVLRRCVTVAGLIRALITMGRRFNTGQLFGSFERDGEIWLCARTSASLQRGRATASEFRIRILLDAIRLAAGPDWRPSEIHVEGPPPPHAEQIAALAERRVHFGRPYAAFVFPARTAALRFPPLIVATPTGGDALPATGFEHSFRQMVEALLRLGTADLAAAAETARTSQRSLQRRLAESGIGFRQLVEEVRFESACRLLGDRERKIVEIAAELGYTDSANFTRAFRRWAGVPPQAFRQTG
jgi:AraC-like DNA-binding protein